MSTENNEDSKTVCETAEETAYYHEEYQATIRNRGRTLAALRNELQIANDTVADQSGTIQRLVAALTPDKKTRLIENVKLPEVKRFSLYPPKPNTFTASCPLCEREYVVGVPHNLDYPEADCWNPFGFTCENEDCEGFQTYLYSHEIRVILNLEIRTLPEVKDEEEYDA